MADNTAPERYRLFIAIRIPEAIKSEVERAQESLRQALVRSEVRWPSREQFHLTLKFLGSVEVQRVDTLTAALRQACRGFKPLPLRAEKLGFFPRPRSPRVAWVGVRDPENQLALVQKAVETACAAFTTEPPEDRFTGHVTLARIKAFKPADGPALEALATRLSSKCFGEWTAEEIELMRSQLSPKGAHHSVLITAPFTK